MDLYSQIFTRASTRKFDPAPLSAETLKELEDFIAAVPPLLPDVKLTHKIVSGSEVKGLALPKAPHYLLISGEDHPLKLAAAGYLYQHAELWLYANGYATRWLAGAKGKEPDENHIIGLAFGKPSGTASRRHEEFNRKSLAEISEGVDSRLEAARLAPSGVNAQPWYFIVDGGKVNVYYKKSLGGLVGRMYTMTQFDAGIALCHLSVAGGHEGKDFTFTADAKAAPDAPIGFVYLGTVE